MKTIEEYLKDFPNASLAQYKEYCDNYKKKEFETEKQAKENYVGWLESMEGKWFVINFNGESYALMKYTKQNINGVYPRSYHFVNKHNDCNIYDETSARLNPLWLNDLNPYTNDYLAGYQRPSGVRWVKPETQEYWGWFDNEKQDWTFIFPNYWQLYICFPYGLPAHEKHGDGKAYRLKLI